jgi:TRAP-type transport system periplasmic protein
MRDHIATRHARGHWATPVLIASARTGSLAAGQTLKISHQFPGGSIDEGALRDRNLLPNLKNAPKGGVTAQVYPISR